MIPDLTRITRLAELLGDPQLAYPSVHVTGTNGKTSVVRMSATLLSAVGLSAGTYTSPHLQTVRERFAVTGRWIGEQSLAEVYDQVLPIAELVDAESDDDVTYFELLTAMAFWWFADKPVDIGVFEVGMGGTWDATNLVRGDVAVITPIDLDHRELGDSPVAVATEKAGIIKPGGHVVTGRQRDDVQAVLDARAAEVGATVRRWGVDHEVLDRRVAVGGQYLNLRVGDRSVDEIFLPLHGSHQADNACLALAALAGVLGERFGELDDDLIRAGLAAVSAPGRLEIVHRDPTVILDGAHNPHGARTAAEALGEAFEFRNLVLVLACLADKDLAGIVDAFRDVANHVVVTAPDSPRAAPATELHAIAVAAFEGTGVVVELADDVESALMLATGVAGEGDGVLVTGSLYTVGAARDVYLPVVDDGDEVVREPEDMTEEEEEDEFQRAIDAMIERVDGETAEGTPDA